MHIGKTIYRFRIAKNITIGELSKSSNIEKKSLIDIESGRCDPTFNVLSMLCKGLDVTIQELIGASNDELEKVRQELSITIEEKNKLQDKFDQLNELYSHTNTKIKNGLTFAQLELFAKYLFDMYEFGFELTEENLNSGLYKKGVGVMFSVSDIIHRIEKDYNVKFDIKEFI